VPGGDTRFDRDEHEPVPFDVERPLRLELVTVVPQPPEQLFAAFVSPDQLPRWWGPHGFSTPEVVVDPRPGGRYRLTMQPPDGEAFHVTGEFLEVDPPRRLSYTFRYEEPDPDDRETVVVLGPAAVDDGTEITLSQGPFATEERRRLHRDGWTESLERLRALVAPDSRNGHGG
jgi:uncharacterized protein YndB with AHSA1/START domain